jgi:DNA-binding beta-propeller fold protein YncE/predicted GH43/DUF377 family glycosyl hydrolase
MLSRALPLLLIAGCVRDAPLPFVGECADYPDSVYAQGQIGIGRCLAGPTSLRFAGDEDEPTLLVTNANPFLIFDGGNLLSIPWSNVDLLTERNLVHTLEPVAIDVPNFASPLAVHGELGLMGVRESTDGRTRVYDDSVWLFDLTDPAQPELSDRGTDGGSQVVVKSDPVDVVVDAQTGLAFAANRTSHDISVLDTTSDTIEVVQPWPEHVVTAAVFDDLDGSGATASLIEFQVLDTDLLPNDSWTLTWVDGSYRLWMPGIFGLWRATNHGDDTYHKSALGIELDLEDAPEDVVEIADPFHLPTSPALMLFASDGEIRTAVSGEYIGDWRFQSTVLLAGGLETWDAHIGGPALVADEDFSYLFYDGAADETGADSASAIGVAISADGSALGRLQAEPVLSPLYLHEGDHIADPHVIFDAEAQVWRMFYSAFDGTQWTIGHASSTDLLSWVQDDLPVFAPADGTQAAAPVVHAAAGGWRMWFSRWNGRRWSVGMASSPDGTHWTNQGKVLHLDADLDQHAFPPGPALQAEDTAGFQVRGVEADLLGVPLIPGQPYLAQSSGWAVEAVAGHHLGAGGAGPDSAGGVRVDSLDVDSDGNGQAWLTLTSRGGRTRIGSAQVQDQQLSATWGAVFEGSGSGFDKSGVSSPVVFTHEGEQLMLHAGFKNGRSTVGLATRTDGLSWDSEGQVLGTGIEWESVSLVPNSVQVLDGGDYRLWYSGFDGARWRVGSATSSDGRRWTREPGLRGYLFAPGAPGEWDDSGVRDAWVLTDDQGDHMWYSGFDGDRWQLGYARRAPGQADWTRFVDSSTDLTRPLLAAELGLFHPDGMRRPVVRSTEDGLQMWFAGQYSGVNRVGRAFGIGPTSWNKTPLRPSVGDTLSFDTERGDPDQWSIPLDALVKDSVTSGIGLTALAVDDERGMLYAVSKLRPYVYVIDIRDDSDLLGTGFQDLNYLDIEAILIADTSSQATGFRQLIPVPGTDKLLAICDSPESVAILDLSSLVDDAFEDVIDDVAVGWLPAPRGLERDLGADTRSSVGPGQMLLHPDGQRLFVSQFNINAITTYDLSLGPYGSLVRETRLVGENPYALALSPDGRMLVFGNTTGELHEDEANSTLGVLDVDENSPTYLEVRTWIAND